MLFFCVSCASPDRSDRAGVSSQDIDEVIGDLEASAGTGASTGADGSSAADSGSDDLAADLGAELDVEPDTVAGGDDFDLDAGLEGELSVTEDSAAPGASEEDDFDIDDTLATDTVQEEPDSAPSLMGESRVVDMGYMAAESGGSFVVKLEGGFDFDTREKPASKQFIVELRGAVLAPQFKRDYIIKEFGAPFKMVSPYNNSRGQKGFYLVVQMDEYHRPEVRKEGSRLIISPSTLSQSELADVAKAGAAPENGEAGSAQPTLRNDIAPVTTDSVGVMETVPGSQNQDFGSDYDESQRMERPLDAQALDEFLRGPKKYYGKRINLEVRDALLMDVINFISRTSNINMMVADGVKQIRITARLRNLPWDEIFTLILRSKKLGYLRQGSVLRIDTLQNLAVEQREMDAILRARLQTCPPKTVIIPVNYTELGQAVTQITPLLEPKTPGGLKGTVISDAQRNRLIVTACEEQVKAAQEFIAKTDTVPEQVMIESKIVEANESFSRSLGVSFGTSPGLTNTLSETGGHNGGPLLLTHDFDVRPSSGNVGGVGTAHFNIGAFNFLGTLDAALAIGEVDEHAEVISAPRVVTLNNQAATISQSTQSVAFSAVRDNSGQVSTQVSTTPVSLSLNVTPTITPNGDVRLQVSVSRQSAGGRIESGGASAQPTSGRQVSTNILVRSGETAVIAGVYHQEKRQGGQGLPILKNIPILGWLFKSRTWDVTKNELLIFLTPRLLSKNSNAMFTN